MSSWEDLSKCITVYKLKLGKRRSVIKENNPDENALRCRWRQVMFPAPTEAHRVFVKLFRRRMRACECALDENETAFVFVFVILGTV